MSRHRSVAAIVAVQLAVAGCAAPATAELAVAPFAPDSGNVVLRCGSLIDGSADQAQRDVTVVIEGGRIATVAAGARAPRELPLIDLSGYTCLPGLIDMHTHLVDRPGDTGDLSIYYHRTVEAQVAIGRETGQLGAGAGAAGRTVVGTARAEHIAATVGAVRILGEEFDVINVPALLAGDAGQERARQEHAH